MVKILLLLIVLVNGLFAFRFFTDFMKHKKEAWAEPGNNVLLAVWGAVCFFFSTFGISDFALSTVLYRARKLIDDAKLPGTLNTQCAIPVAVMALAYISSIELNLYLLRAAFINSGLYIFEWSSDNLFISFSIESLPFSIFSSL